MLPLESRRGASTDSGRHLTTCPVARLRPTDDAEQLRPGLDLESRRAVDGADRAADRSRNHVLRFSTLKQRHAVHFVRRGRRPHRGRDVLLEARPAITSGSAVVLQSGLTARRCSNAICPDGCSLSRPYAEEVGRGSRGCDRVAQTCARPACCPECSSRDLVEAHVGVDRICLEMRSFVLCRPPPIQPRQHPPCRAPRSPRRSSSSTALGGCCTFSTVRRTRDQDLLLHLLGRRRRGRPPRGRGYETTNPLVLELAERLRGRGPRLVLSSPRDLVLDSSPLLRPGSSPADDRVAQRLDLPLFTARAAMGLGGYCSDNRR